MDYRVSLIKGEYWGKRKGRVKYIETYEEITVKNVWNLIKIIILKLRILKNIKYEEMWRKLYLGMLWLNCWKLVLREKL